MAVLYGEKAVDFAVKFEELPVYSDEGGGKPNLYSFSGQTGPDVVLYYVNGIVCYVFMPLIFFFEVKVVVQPDLNSHCEHLERKFRQPK